jgi:alpha-1,2-mannosyltransferase
MLLFSERTWKHHDVTLLLPVALLVYYLATCRPGQRVRAYLVGSLALVQMTLTWTGVLDGIDRGGKLAQVCGAYL